MEMTRVLILYRELAGYVVACINHLSACYGAQVDVVAYPLNSDAPFQFQFHEDVRLESRSLYDVNSLRKKIGDKNYDLILVSGWADRDYLNALSASKRAIKVVGFDTWWYGTPKQYLAAIYARFFITGKFNYAFVPGPEQTELALKFGFTEKQILQGIYSCDVPRFSTIAQNRMSRSENSQKKLIYTGRYASEKFIVELCEAMIELHHEGFTQWKLQCIGPGPLFNSRIEHESIVHEGFRQPDELAALMLGGDAFVLPSTFEPWGVVVHEFAAAGYPIVLSDQVGARHAFMDEGRNGFTFKSGDRHELKSALKKIMLTPHHKLLEMGNISATLAKKINPDTWAKTLLQLL